MNGMSLLTCVTSGSGTSLLAAHSRQPTYYTFRLQTSISPTFPCTVAAAAPRGLATFDNEGKGVQLKIENLKHMFYSSTSDVTYEMTGEVI